jgi:hypothetical protein
MATKAEWFRYEQERSGPKQVKQEPRGAKVHHEPVRAGKKAVFALEDSVGPPSRKTTRKASNRSKTDVQMRMKRKTAEMRPSAIPGPARAR